MLVGDPDEAHAETLYGTAAFTGIGIRNRDRAIIQRMCAVYAFSQSAASSDVGDERRRLWQGHGRADLPLTTHVISKGQSNE